MARKLVLLLLCTLLVPGAALAYDEQTTHPALTQEIVEYYNLVNPGSPLTPEQAEWVIEGSTKEDIAPRWINHFYDPVHNVGWTGEKAGAISPSTIQKITSLGLSSADPLSAVAWLNDYQAQQAYVIYGGNRAWKRGLEYYSEGSEEEAYRTLGHALHLLEDMGVPDHTRNDTHAHAGEQISGDNGSPYEDFAQRYTRGSIKTLGIPQALHGASITPPSRSRAEDYLAVVSNYSNRYFFSKDTINDPKYSEPKIVREEGRFGYAIDEVSREFPVVAIERTMDGRTLSLSKEEDNYPILESYFSHLSRQIVWNGAGMVELFKRQAEDAKTNEAFYGHSSDYQLQKALSKLTAPNVSLLGLLSALSDAGKASLAWLIESLQGGAGAVQQFFSRFAGNTADESGLLLAVVEPESERKEQSGELDVTPVSQESEPEEPVRELTEVSQPIALTQNSQVLGASTEDVSETTTTVSSTPSSTNPTSTPPVNVSGGGSTSFTPAPASSETTPVSPPAFESYFSVLAEQAVYSGTIEMGVRSGEHRVAQTFVSQHDGIISEVELGWEGEILGGGAASCSFTLHQTDIASAASDGNRIARAYFRSDPSYFVGSGTECFTSSTYYFASSTVAAFTPYTFVFSYQDATHFPETQGAEDVSYGIYALDGTPILASDLFYKVRGLITAPTGTAPALSAPPNFAATFDSGVPSVTLSWGRSADYVTPERDVSYEFNFSTSSLSESGWGSLGANVFGTSTVVVYPNTYNFGVRARTASAVSPASTISWNFPSSYIPQVLSVSLGTASQEFTMPRTGMLQKITLSTANFTTANALASNECFVEVFATSDLATSLARSATPDLSFGDCAGSPQFTFPSSTAPTLTSGTHYTWKFTIPFHGSVKFYGISINQAGGLFTGDSALTNAVFTLEDNAGVALQTGVAP